MNLINESQVFETWSPILEEKTGITDTNKLKWMTKYAHYHSLNEGFTYPQASLLNTPGMGNVAPASTVAGGAASFYGAGSKGSGDKFPSLLPLAIQVAARTIGFDIVSVVPMNGPSGVLTYLDYVYAGGRDAQAAGIPSSSSVGGAQASFADKALAFKLASNIFTGGVFTTLVPPAVGSVYLITKDSDVSGGLGWNAGTYPGLFVAYVGKSRIDGFPIFKVLGESNSGTYSASAGGTVTANVATGQTQTVSFANVIDGSTASYIYSVASYTQTTGAFGAVNTSSAGTLGNGDVINNTATKGYVQLVSALEDHIFGFSGAGPNDSDPYEGDGTDGTVAYEPMRRGVGETSYYRTMGLQAFTKFVEAETFQVAATVTTEQIQDLNRQYGIDVVSMMENALVNEISQSINKHILSRAFALGWQNAYDFSATEGVNLNLTLNASSGTSTTATFIGKDNASKSINVPQIAMYASTGTNFENQGTFQRRIQSKVLAAANVVAQRGRRGPGNFVVTNLQIATALQDSAQFTFYPLANTVNQNNGALYPLGTLAGMTIYVDPNMKYGDTRVLVGRKGADEEPGLKFMPYLMAESIQTIAEGTMAPKLAVKSRYALVEAGFHPQTQYFTFLVNLRAISNSGSWNSTADTMAIA